VRFESDRRVVWLALGLLTAIAAALRLPFLSHQSLWLDEIYTRTIVGRHGLAAIWRNVQATESTPPLYYLAAKLSTVLFGSRSAAAMRAPSALALTAAVPVAYFAFRRLIGERPALAAAAFVAVNPLLVNYSTDARSYGLLVLTALLSVWGLAAVLESGRQRAFAGWAAASVACVWTHYFGAFTVIGEAVVLLTLRPQARRATLAWCVAIVACTAPLIPLLAHQNGSEDSAFITGISLLTRLEQTVRQFGMGANVPRAWLEGAGLVVLGVGVVAGAVGAWRRSGPRIVLALPLFTAVVPLAIGMVGIEDRFYVRNVIAALPLVGALAAPALLRARATPLVVYLVLATLTSVWVATNWRYEQADWRTAIVRAQAMDGSAPVITVGTDSRPVAVTYLGRAPTDRTVPTADVLVIVQPYRGPGDRALVPASVPGSVSQGLSGFTTIRETVVHGFRLILMRSSRPKPLAPRTLQGPQPAEVTLFPSR
jgi:uncharacterized membrane protein